MPQTKSTFASVLGIAAADRAVEDGLAQADVALISDIVTGQTDYALSQIRVIEVK
ncbi:hypothetical protein [Mitsuokella multacida]|uniref:hypothetical protein n=1 Tax=Mitsuokella multacida TaxID=52226 RepID=UPI003FED4E5C